MKATMRSAILCAVLVLGGCYHATIETGLRPSTVTIEKKWANGWVLGLVPPSTVETMERCPAGVARVETQLSFLNQLVNALTFGIYTPMEIVVTCADDRTSDTGLPRVEDARGFEDALASGAPFLVAVR